MLTRGAWRVRPGPARLAVCRAGAGPLASSVLATESIALPSLPSPPHPSARIVSAHNTAEPRVASSSRNRDQGSSHIGSAKESEGDRRSSSPRLCHGDRLRPRRHRRRPPCPRRLRHNPISCGAEDHGRGVLAAASRCDYSVACWAGLMHVGWCLCSSKVPFGAPTFRGE